MKAYVASVPKNDRSSRSDARSQFCMPKLKCEQCEQDWRALGRIPPLDPSVWSETEIWYPSLGLKAGADASLFSNERTVSVAELGALRKFVSEKGSKAGKLLPGAGFGPVFASLPKRPTNFLWCSFKILASRRTMEVMLEAGIVVPSGPVFSLTTRQETNYVALQLDPVALYSEQTLKEMTLVFCSTCGQCWMQDVRAKRSGPRQFLRKRVPEENGLVKSFEGFHTLVSNRFMEVVKTKNLTGIEFEEFGIYV